MVTIKPGILFAGDCEEAFAFYKTVFGGEFTGISRYKDMPNAAEVVPADCAEKITHIELVFGDKLSIAGGDVVEAVQGKVARGNGYTIQIEPASLQEGQVWFDRLGADGIVKSKLEKAFWGAIAGEVCDKFGVNWYFNIPASE